MGRNVHEIGTYYRVTVSTGDIPGAGTNASVYLTLFGSEGNSSEYSLDSSDDDFERGDIGTYKIYSSELGNIEFIRIRHDNSGKRPGWFLDEVTVTNERTKKVWIFPCHRWLARDEDDHSINRILFPR
ncbi:MAG: PLAT/LH2 domain-containing protein [Evtepia sp.]|uniref:PLAT/LH2 domain-containing protein n=1 Tax=Evtepia sp. TaxID=2773933 RepID=UPI002A74DA27|nr:PLAT/LH2 domain-containing protein [Evtepia sp.]MDY3015195.1 PLAT/LH2 domain-containing protein [Evtepia sp.]